MIWTNLYLNTPIPQIPKILNTNFASFKLYIDSFYDGSLGTLIVPIETGGKIKGGRGEFVTAVVDNLIVKRQFTNLYENNTTADLDWVNAYNDVSTGTRASTDVSVNKIWPYEPSTYKWIDIESPYYKLTNDVSYGFQNDNISQQFRIILDTSVATTSPYHFLLESSLGGESKLEITASDASATWITLICVNYDVSLGPKWVIKEYGGTYSIV